MNRRWVAAWVAALVAVLGLGVTAGCGGVGSGGTGISEGLAQGTVNGFGSIIVDGYRIDDSQVPTLAETAPDVLTQTSARLGDRVVVDVSAAGAARRLDVDATLVGAISAAAAPDGFEMLGQTVRVNADAARGPVTQFGGGYTGIGSVLAGDAVEVHGFIVRSAGGAVVQATRVQRLAALPAFLKVTGVVGDLGPQGLRIGDLEVRIAMASVVPSGTALADGQVVAVWAPADSLTEPPGAMAQLRAAKVRIKRPGDDGTEVYLSGAVAALDAAAARFDLGGVTVRFAGALLSPAGATLADGRYVRVRGVVQADGAIQASAVRLRDEAEAEAELKGNVDGYIAATRSFSVRGVAVDAGGATIEGCPGGVPAEGLYVEVKGTLGATGVIASKVECESETSDDTVERKGVVGAVDVAASRFVLTPSTGAALTVVWTASTYFPDGTPQALSGQRVEVDGRLADGVLTAQKVSRDD